MSIAYDPNQRITVTLESDSALPEGDRPAFVFRAMSGRDSIRFMELCDELDGGKSPSQIITAIYDAIRVALSDWRNVKGVDGKELAFDPARIDEVMTIGEARELLMGLRDSLVPTADELGKSDSQP